MLLVFSCGKSARSREGARVAGTVGTGTRSVVAIRAGFGREFPDTEYCRKTCVY